VSRCEEAIAAEREAREETEQSMMQMIQDMEATLRQEIADERAERERSEEGFMSLLEETCARIEKNLMS
jgi:hypothetical protein